MTSSVTNWLQHVIVFDYYPFFDKTDSTFIKDKLSPSLVSLSLKEGFECLPKLATRSLLEAKFNWVPKKLSPIRLLLKIASKHNLEDIRSRLKELVPFVVSNHSNKYFHLFREDLAICFELGLLNAIEDQKLIVQLSHPLEWIDFCRSLPKDNLILGPKRQCQLLKETMLNYKEDIFEHTFSILDSLPIYYAKYLAAAVFDSSFLQQMMTKILKSQSEDFLPKNSFTWHFNQLHNSLHRRNKICQFVKKYLTEVKGNKREILNKFILKWQPQGWNVDFDQLRFNFSFIDVIETIANVYTVRRDPYGHECLQLIDGTDLATLLVYFEENSNKDYQVKNTLDFMLVGRLQVNWSTNLETGHFEDLKDLKNDQILILAKIIMQKEVINKKAILARIFQQLDSSKKQLLAEKCDYSSSFATIHAM